MLVTSMYKKERDLLEKYTYVDFLAAFGVGGAHPGGFHLTKQLLNKETIDRSFHILDAGCGTGQTSAYISEKYNCKISALDCNKVMIEKAKNRIKKLELPITIVHGTVENLPFPTSTFDVVLSESVLAFTNIPKSLSEFVRVIKTNGSLIAIEMTTETSLTLKEQRVIKDFYGVSKLFSEAQWLKVFNDAGFKRVFVKKISLPDESNQKHSAENATEFDLSPAIDSHLYDILEKHEHLHQQFQQKLGYRVYKCII